MVLPPEHSQTQAEHTQSQILHENGQVLVVVHPLLSTTSDRF